MVERASLDPEFEFMGLDGCLTAYVSKETGSMPFLAECQGKKEFDKNSE